MPKNATAGAIAIVVTARDVATFAFSPADAVASLQAIPPGGTACTLPDDPQSGDRYEWVDVDGSCSASSPITIVASPGTTILGGATLEQTVAFASGAVVFDESVKAWGVFAGTIAAPPAPTASQTFYVSKAGSDTTGNGTEARPFLTIERAMEAILDSSAAKRYLVSVGPGEYADPFNIKPWTAVVGVDAGSNGVTPDGSMITEILAPADTCGFDPAWETSGFSVGWYAALGFQNHQTWDQATRPGIEPQLNFRGCAFNAGADYLGPGTVGFDNVLWQDCLSYGGVHVKGWQFLWTRHCEFLGGEVSIEAGPAGADENTTWLSQDTAVGSDFAPTNVTIKWAAPSPATVSARGDMANTAVVGVVTLDGAHTSYVATTDAAPSGLVQMNGAPVPVFKGYTPTSLANWSGVAPFSRANALDRIAAKIGPIP